LSRRTAISRAALAAIAGLLALGAGTAAAAAPGYDIREVARQMSIQAAAPWPHLQRAGGSFRDDIHEPTPYAESILGYGLLQTGLREHDDKLIGSAFKAFGWVIRNRYTRPRTSVFQNWSMAASYNLARRAIGGDSRFRRLVPGWQRLLRHQVVARLDPTSHYGNHQLVEALEVLELRSTGLRSGFSKGVIGPSRSKYLKDATGLINRRIPGMAAARTVNVGGDPTFLLSDPPDEPMAYQGLSLGMYARGLQLMGGGARGATRSVLRSIAEASWRLAAPDGDLGYMGRNEEQAWTLSATAFGAHDAAISGGPAAERARYQGVADRALQRLAAAHMGGPDGLYILPGLRQDFRVGKRAITHGAAGSAMFVGLTLVYLNLLAGSPDPGPAPSGVAADQDGTAILGSGESLRAAVRHGDIWFSTRAVPSVIHSGDVRYDPGLNALKHLTSDGAWRDVIPARPLVDAGAPSDSTGPLLRTPRGRAILSAHRIVARPGGTVDLVGAYQQLGGRRKTGRAGVERIEPVACGAQVSFSGRKGDRLEYSVFMHDGKGGPAVGPDSVTSGGTQVAFTPRARVQVRRGYVSASDPFVARVTLRWTAQARRLFKVTICDGQ
jgi:hypothetical protein